MLSRIRIEVIILLVLGSIGICACTDQDNTSSESTDVVNDAVQDTSDTQLPDDFIIFYDQFHSEEEFQLSRITWPLRGLPDQADTVVIDQSSFFFQKEDWSMHRKLNDPEGNFDQYFAIVDPKLIIERIELKGSNLRMERRFAKLNEEWNLIYYQGMNPTK